MVPCIKHLTSTCTTATIQGEKSQLGFANSKTTESPAFAPCCQKCLISLLLQGWHLRKLQTFIDLTKMIQLKTPEPQALGFKHGPREGLTCVKSRAVWGYRGGNPGFLCDQGKVFTFPNCSFDSLILVTALPSFWPPSNETFNWVYSVFWETTRWGISFFDSAAQNASPSHCLSVKVYTAMFFKAVATFYTPVGSSDFYLATHHTLRHEFPELFRKKQGLHLESGESHGLRTISKNSTKPKGPLAEILQKKVGKKVNFLIDLNAHWQMAG